MRFIALDAEPGSVFEGLPVLPEWLLFGLALGVAFTVAAAGLFAVAMRFFPEPVRSRRGISGDDRRRAEIRDYLDSIGEHYAEDHSVAGHPVAFYLPDRDVAITFDARTFFRMEKTPTHPVLVEHELPGGALGDRLPFETPSRRRKPGTNRSGRRPFAEYARRHVWHRDDDGRWTTPGARGWSAGRAAGDFHTGHLHGDRPQRESVGDAFATLSLDADATLEDVKAAYREQAKAVHPDQGGDREDFQRVREAYTIAKESVSGSNEAVSGSNE